MKVALTALISSVLCLCKVSCQVPAPGSCEPFTVVPDFNISAYMGRWYDIQHFPVYYEYGLDCVFTTYTLADDPSQGRSNRTFFDINPKTS